ncbi:MAG: head-tail connector protein [Azonexus sp.]
MFLKQTAPPAAEPLSLAEAKAHLRVDASDDDALITALIGAARQYAETECQRVFVTQSWQLLLDSFPGPSLMGVPAGVPFSLPKHAILVDRSPVQTIDSIQYMDMAGAWQTMPVGDYAVDLNCCPARITPAFGKIWPITMPQIAAVKVNFTAGYGTAAAVPQGIKAWMLIRIGTLYENRTETANINSGKLEPLPYIDRLLDGYRVEIM